MMYFFNDNGLWYYGQWADVNSEDRGDPLHGPFSGPFNTWDEVLEHWNKEKS